jgi:hypothetical protein
MTSRFRHGAPYVAGRFMDDAPAWLLRPPFFIASCAPDAAGSRTYRPLTRGPADVWTAGRDEAHSPSAQRVDEGDYGLVPWL